MTIQQLIPYITSATVISFLVASISVFIDMMTNTNLESKLMPLKKYIKNILIMIIFISLLLSAFIHISLILSKDIILLYYDKEAKIYSVEYTTLISIAIVTLLIIALMITISVVIFFVGKILEVKSIYFIKLSGNEKWILVKVTYNNKFLLKKTNSNSSREYKIIDNLDSQIIQEELVVEGWRKKLYTKWCKRTVISCSLVLLISLGSLIWAEIKNFNSSWLIVAFVFLALSLSVLIYYLAFRRNLKKMNLIN